MADASVVVLYKEWEKVPVFHLLGHRGDDKIIDRRFELEDGWTWVEKTIRTACGTVVQQWGWEEHPDKTLPWSERFRNHRNGPAWPTTLRRDHAKAFGRLCRRCEKAATS